MERFRPGYPRFATLIGRREQFRMFRQFAEVRMRLILYKQDEISVLQAELLAIDNAEERPLFLGARRRDRNQQRLDKLRQLDAALVEYGESSLSPLTARGEVRPLLHLSDQVSKSALHTHVSVDTWLGVVVDCPRSSEETSHCSIFSTVPSMFLLVA